MNTLLIGVVLFLAACGTGRAVYEPTLVADELLDNFETIATSLNEARGYTVISVNPQGRGTVVIDDALASAQRTENGYTLGYTRRPDISIRGDMSESFTSHTLAHEIGHALGLRHTATGLMAPVLDSSPDNPCLEDPGLCLSNALDAAGL